MKPAGLGKCACHRCEFSYDNVVCPHGACFDAVNKIVVSLPLRRQWPGEPVATHSSAAPAEGKRRAVPAGWKIIRDNPAPAKTRKTAHV